MNILSYKYDFELRSKSKFFLWMYFVIPNIDIINKIYKLKEEQELYEAKIYYGVLPNNITIIGRTPKHINSAFQIHTLQDKQYMNRLLVKYIVEPGFICSFTFQKEDYTNIELCEIDNGNWYSVIPNINLNPPLKDKINCINNIFKSEPYVEYYIFTYINRMYMYYLNNTIMRIGIDQTGKYYMTFI